MRWLAWLVAKRQEGSVQPGACCPIPALPFWEAFRVWLSVCSADSALSSCWSRSPCRSLSPRLLERQTDQR